MIPAHKKPLPKYPHTIAIITSAAGAAIMDMLRILGKRYPLTKVKLLPVRVQGAEAPAEIAGAIRYANRYQVADLHHYRPRRRLDGGSLGVQRRARGPGHL